ncbi:MAG: ATP synthase F1 subunit delta [Candidatus Omnitrophica bacterium CG11_big_fil_rev_8_21_14_0_20_63_9]|nr:MAG: ATP synthase F1 subunit delta [Candidatus Omnitrophica bacterium CG11_big_fil_rev_8_21_14_0_20_63_9]
MSADPIASRYAQALFEAASAEGSVEETLKELELIGRLFDEEPLLRELFLNPDVDPEDKVGIFERVLKGSWSDTVRAFTRMLVSFGRESHIPQIVEALSDLVDAAQGRLRVVVRSAHPLPETVVSRLRARLEQAERKTVEVRAEVDPALIGGVQVELDHRVIDGSVRRQLAELRERLSSVKVF